VEEKMKLIEIIWQAATHPYDLFMMMKYTAFLMIFGFVLFGIGLAIGLIARKD
jgi:hypothetical protein